MKKEKYQEIVDENLRKFREEYEAIVKARKAVISQLGLKDKGPGLEAALILQWLLRLYARKIGEIKLLKLVKGIIGEFNGHNKANGKSS